MISKNTQFLTLIFLTIVCTIQGQEIQLFTLEDFDLRNEVKFCLVSTDYGKEEYDFNKKGFLTKSVTRYNDTDYDVVHYKYEEGDLIEKRSESYRDNAFDPSTSIAHFYEIDSTDNLKIQERIFSYDKEFWMNMFMNMMNLEICPAFAGPITMVRILPKWSIKNTRGNIR